MFVYVCLVVCLFVLAVYCLKCFVQDIYVFLQEKNHTDIKSQKLTITHKNSRIKCNTLDIKDLIYLTVFNIATSWKPREMIWFSFLSCRDVEFRHAASICSLMAAGRGREPLPSNQRRTA